jgi:hypothetical protein
MSSEKTQEALWRVMSLPVVKSRPFLTHFLSWRTGQPVPYQPVTISSLQVSQEAQAWSHLEIKYTWVHPKGWNTDWRKDFMGLKILDDIFLESLKISSKKL